MQRVPVGYGSRHDTDHPVDGGRPDAGRPMRTTGKVVLVTGASSGIGRATALRAAGEGAHVVLVARGERTLRTVAEECEEAGAGSVMVLPADVGDDRAVASFVREAVARHGRLDAVVSNAGVVSYGRTEDVPAEVFDRVLRTNLCGAANVARHVVPVLRRQGAGSLLYVGSVVGHVAVPSLNAYTVSKWGVRILVRQLRIENRDLPGVRIGYVAPGGVDTPIFKQAANYTGYQGRPPPPVSGPDRVARQILDRLDGRGRAQLSAVNHLIRFGFVALPAVYDRLVGPLCLLASIDLERPTGPTPGNVLASREDLHDLTGDHGSSLAGVARNVAYRLRMFVARDDQMLPR
jgi:NAD(P)-dependent dehydrogenase (short-subunit alcohol dehydrogenase family)